MIAARRIRAVATYEFITTVKRKGYLIATFGMPVFVLLYGLVIALPQMLRVGGRQEPKIYGVVDVAGVLGLTGDVAGRTVQVPREIGDLLEATGRRGAIEPVLDALGALVFRPLPGEDAARAALAAGGVKGYFVLREDFLASGRVDAYFTEKLDLDAKEARRPFGDLVRARLLAGRVPEAVAARAGQPVAEWREWTLTAAGQAQQRSPFSVFARIAIPLAFGVLMLICLMMSAGYLIQATATEKENRVVEVLLSSANPDEILAGKLLGLGAAGLLQVCVWFGMLAVGGLASAATLSAAGVEIPWHAIGACLLFFVAGYLFLGSLMVGTGSLGSNMRESQQFSFVWSLSAVVPMIFLMPLLEAPHGAFARTLTWIPFTAPLTIVFRMAIGPEGIHWWEIAGSFAVLVASTVVAIRVGARLFRVGILLTGTRPKLRDILRQARLAG